MMKDKEKQRAAAEANRKAAKDALFRELKALEPKAKLTPVKYAFNDSNYELRLPGSTVWIHIKIDLRWPSGYYGSTGPTGEVDITVGDYREDWKKRFPSRKAGHDFKAIAAHAVDSHKKKQALHAAKLDRQARVNESQLVADDINGGCGVYGRVDCPLVKVDDEGGLYVHLPRRTIAQTSAEELLKAAVEAYGTGTEGDNDDV